MYSISFNPFNEHLFLTGGGDKQIGLYDLRTVKRVHTFESHNDAILKVDWSNFDLGTFASSSVDRRVMIWDLTKIGA